MSLKASRAVIWLQIIFDDAQGIWTLAFEKIFAIYLKIYENIYEDTKRDLFGGTNTTFAPTSISGKAIWLFRENAVTSH